MMALMEVQAATADLAVEAELVAMAQVGHLLSIQITPTSE